MSPVILAILIRASAWLWRYRGDPVVSAQSVLRATNVLVCDECWLNNFFCKGSLTIAKNARTHFETTCKQFL